MVEGCPSGRDCSICPYEKMCGGCIGTVCIHKKLEKETPKQYKNNCLFCSLNGLSCKSNTIKPPTDFELASPDILEEMVKKFQYCDIPLPQDDLNLPLLIPEVSSITPTTSRLGVEPDEGKWSNPFFDPIAWDMTGNLFDKVRGAPWVSEPSECKDFDWREILGSESNWINNILLIDRLPDQLALQTPPSAVMIAYLNRLMTYYPNMLYDKDAPYPWLVTHGYPSYIDWPPAWHFNLGIRMLSSLLAYLMGQEEGNNYIESGAWYPDKSRQTQFGLPLPYIEDNQEHRILWNPEGVSRGPTEMEWPRFPGIIPFIPGADTNQVAWFGKLMIQAGFSNLAIDAVNTLAHENFKGLNNVVNSLRTSGSNKVLIYGPWPLHIPSTERPIHGVSYVSSANHIDLTNSPARYWRKEKEDDSAVTRWRELPSHKSSSLSSVYTQDELKICDCKSCKNAIASEINPQSIWRWGHLLNAGFDWVIRVQDAPEKKTSSFDEKNSDLWFNGSSYTVFRRCLDYPDSPRCEELGGLVKSLRFSSTRLQVKFPDGLVCNPEEIQWGINTELYRWAKHFPILEE